MKNNQLNASQLDDCQIEDRESFDPNQRKETQLRSFCPLSSLHENHIIDSVFHLPRRLTDFPSGCRQQSSRQQRPKSLD